MLDIPLLRRSGLNSLAAVDAGGTVDSDYIIVYLQNCSDAAFLKSFSNLIFPLNSLFLKS